ncbi:MAG: hypothetical protein JWO05_3682 [Gemmatimonadetes bacterium]|nr:hypothetical protein [Gemmatimonadota bacterium]
MMSAPTTLRDNSATELGAGMDVGCSVSAFADTPGGVHLLLLNSHCSSTAWSVTPDTLVYNGAAIAGERDDPGATTSLWENLVQHAARNADVNTYTYFGSPTGWRGRIGRTTSINALTCYEWECNVTIDTDHRWFAVRGEGRGSVSTGLYLDRVGRTTGWTEGTVSGTCVDIQTPISGQTTKWYKCVNTVGAQIGQGDSGSPVFYRSGDDAVTYYGSAFATSGTTTTVSGLYYASSYVYSPLSNIEADLGYTLTLTTATTVGTPTITPGVLSSHAYLSGYGVTVTNSPDVATYTVWRQLYNGPTQTITENWTVVGTTTSTSFTDTSIGVLAATPLTTPPNPGTTNPGASVSTARYYIVASSFGTSSSGSGMVYYKISNGN